VQAKRFQSGDSSPSLFLQSVYFKRIGCSSGENNAKSFRHHKPLLSNPGIGNICDKKRPIRQEGAFLKMGFRFFTRKVLNKESVKKKSAGRNLLFIMVYNA